MYTPGDKDKMLDKIPALGVDCIVLDCEDGVAANKKEEARQGVRAALDRVQFGLTERCVRVNSVQSGLCEDDLNVVLSAERYPQTILLPKVNSVQDIDWFAEHLDDIPAMKNIEADHLRLVIFIESALSLLSVRDICKRGMELSEYAAFTLDGLVFGSDDYLADIGATRTADAKELLLARQTVVMAAKAHGLQAIDLVHTDLGDQEGLKAQCEEGAAMGFDGKQVINPRQIATVQAAFSPSPEAAERAERLLAEYERHLAEGTGAFVFENQMVDAPLVLQAQNTRRLVQRIRALEQAAAEAAS